MANQEHLEIWAQGVEEWNRWVDEFEPEEPDLSGIDLCGQTIERANFSFANLSNADLSGSTLINVDFRQSLLTDVTLTGANIRYVDFSYAVLKNVNFSHADVAFVNFLGAMLTNADFFHVEMLGTQMSDVDIREVKNLESVKFFGPCTIDINTIYKSHGNIPEKFLRGCGVPENFITYMRSLTAKPIDYYSCFISFTEADDIFSERLYNDMQAAGVSCWRWKEDAKWGRALMRSIDEAVRVYDKLVIVCSEQSLKSPAVIREIERALQKEDDATRGGEEGEVLFPIRLDDFIFTGWNHHRKADVVAKSVGDFRRWTEPVEYKKAFERLMGDLKAEASR
jgi:uncharacterized protein YjbI with pentapeptide repeats